MRTILLDDFTSLAILVWVCLLITTLKDLFCRTDLCVWKKALWAVAVLIVPLGAFAYMVLQSGGILDRKAARLLRSEPDLQPASTFNISDEIAEVDRLVPMIQNAIEIRELLEVGDPAKVRMPDQDQIGILDEMAGGGHVYTPEPNRSHPGHHNSQRLPPVAA